MENSKWGRITAFAVLTLMALVLFSACREPGDGNTPVGFEQVEEQPEMEEVPLDQVAEEALKKLVVSSPENVFQGSVNFSEYIHVNELYPVMKALDPPVEIDTACFRTPDKKAQACWQVRTGTNTASENFERDMKLAYYQESGWYKTVSEKLGNFDQSAYDKLLEGEVEIYGLVVLGTPERLLNLWSELPSIRMISAGGGDLFPPFILAPETPLDLVR